MDDAMQSREPPTFDLSLQLQPKQDRSSPGISRQKNSMNLITCSPYEYQATIIELTKVNCHDRERKIQPRALACNTNALKEGSLCFRDERLKSKS